MPVEQNVLPQSGHLCKSCGTFNGTYRVYKQKKNTLIIVDSITFTCLKIKHFKRILINYEPRTQYVWS